DAPETVDQMNPAKLPSNAPRRRAATIVALLALMPALIGAGAAEPTYSFDSTPGRLPKTVVPVRYTIELEPNLDKLTLAGSELAEIDARAPTAELLLNAVAMTLSRASADDGSQTARIALDAAAETATLTFAQPLAAGTHQLRIDFTAQIAKF